MVTRKYDTVDFAQANQGDDTPLSNLIMPPTTFVLQQVMSRAHRLPIPQIETKEEEEEEEEEEDGE